MLDKRYTKKIIVAVLAQLAAVMESETFTVGASGDSTVDSDGRQEIFVNNECDGDGTTCTGNTVINISMTHISN